MRLDAMRFVEEGLRFAQQRGAVLAEDTANARSPGFSAVDMEPAMEASPDGLRFAAAVRRASSADGTAAIEYVMGATAENGIRFRALADQERSMLREFRSVAEAARR